MRAKEFLKENEINEGPKDWAKAALVGASLAGSLGASAPANAVGPGVYGWTHSVTDWKVMRSRTSPDVYIAITGWARGDLDPNDQEDIEFTLQWIKDELVTLEQCSPNAELQVLKKEEIQNPAIQRAMNKEGKIWGRIKWTIKVIEPNE